MGAVSQTDYIGDFMTRPAATQAIFDREISYCGCHDAKWALVLLKKLFFLRQISRRLDTKVYSIVIWCMRISQNFGLFFVVVFFCFAFARSEFFSYQFSFLFLSPFTLATFCVSYSFWLP